MTKDMGQSEAEASRRRRAIYQGLEPFMSEEKILESLWIWEHEFARRSAFELQGFLDRICDTPIVRQLRKQIHLSLVKRMILPLSALGPDPWRSVQARHGGDSQTSAHAGSPTGANGVLAQVVSGYLEALWHQDAEPAAKIRGQVVSSIGRLKLEPEALGDLVDWLAGRKPAPVIPISLENMRRILHVIYVLACEYYGPVVADRKLAVAIEAAEAHPEAHPEAHQLSPRQLL